MDANMIEVLLGIISFLATTIIGLYINNTYQQHKQYSDFLNRLGSIVGLGGRIIYKDNDIYQLFQVEKIDRQGMVLKGYNKTIFIPISKLMGEEIIVPDINYESVSRDNEEAISAEEQELDEFRHKRIAEIYAHSIKDIMKNHVIPEIKQVLSEYNEQKPNPKK